MTPPLDGRAAGPGGAPTPPGIAPEASPPPARGGSWSGILRACAVLLPTIALWLWLFWPEAEAAVRVWWDSTAYNHCVLVLPLALWLGWERRGRLPGRSAMPEPWWLLLALPAGLAWFAAQRLGIMEGRQLAAMALLEVLFLAVLGWTLFRALAAPLLFLFFLVPFGAFLTPALQRFTAGFVVAGLGVLGIPHSADGMVIAIPEGVFLVAEACAGLRFLIACIAFGVLYALTLFRSTGRRLVFVLLCAVVPVLANGMRALGIVVLGHWLGSAEAAATDHVLYGWLFFSLVIGLLVLLGLPWREDGPQPARPAPWAAGRARSRIAAPAVAAGWLLLAVAGPAVAAMLRGDARLAALPPGWSPPGCSRLVASGNADGPARFRCGPDVELLVQGAAPGEDPGRLPALRRDLTGQDGAEDVQVSPLRTAAGRALPPWQLVRVVAPDSVSVTALWIGGAPARPGLAARLRQAWGGLSGRAEPALLAVLRADGPGAAALLTSAVEDDPALGEALARLSERRAGR